MDNEVKYQEIDQQFRPRIRRYMARMAGEHEADDLTQEVLLKVSKALDAFRGDARVSTWIYRIATNAALDRLRSRSFQDGIRTTSLDDDETEKVVSIEFIGHGTSSSRIDENLVQKEMNSCIRNIVMDLPVDHRTVLILSEFEGLANREIAAILQTSLETVKIRLHRARKKLKKELESHCSFYRNDRNDLCCDRKTPPADEKISS
jgi:RNA polymerase sigma-70 factor (ECF subfamily)